VVSNPEFEAIAPDLAARAEHEAAQRADALRATAVEQAIALTVDVHRAEEAWQAIVAAAEAARADLVIVRRRGRRGFAANLRLGETVGRVLGHVACSALVVPRACVRWSRRVAAVGDDRVATLAAALADEDRLPLLRVDAAVGVDAIVAGVAGADLVVVARDAAHGRIGTTARALIERSGVPVLAV
jgi:nucleotide-binding universal stress UspA family protein